MHSFRTRPEPVRSTISSVRLLGLLCLVTGSFLPFVLKAAPPAWWTMRGVTNASSAPFDYAAINQGQLKNLAKAAMQEMDAHVPGGAGDDVHLLISKWSTVVADTKDFASVNLGQLKAVAKPFYSRFIAVGYTDRFPWTASLVPPNDFEIANIGQAKYLFAFDLALPGAGLDLDHNGLPDWWEMQYFGHTGVDPNTMAPCGGVTILQAYQQGINPLGSSFSGSLALNIVGGDGQSGATGAVLPQPLTVNVRTASLSPLANAIVTFQVTAEAGGRLAPVGNPTAAVSDLSVNTDVNGNAAVSLRLASNSNNHCVVNATSSANVNGNNLASNSIQFVATILVADNVLKAPTNLQYTVLPDAAVRISWNDDSNHADSFLIQRKAVGGAWQDVDTVTGHTFTFTDGAASTTQAVFYRVVAINTTGQSPSDPLYVGRGRSITITSPAEGEQTTAHGQLVLTAIALDADSPTSKVEYFEGAVKLGEAEVTPYTFVWLNVSSGLHVITAVATDGKGTQVKSDPVNISTVGFPYIAAGGERSFSLAADGTLWAWGSNDDGQLGVGSTTPASFSAPVKIGGTIGTKSVEAGNHHTLILNADGTVSAFGSNDDGQLGNGNSSSQRVPTPVSGLFGVIAVAASSNASLALKTDGTVWMWGGRSKAPPAQVSGLSNVRAIAAGATHFLALTVDHSVWAWGDNFSGQLGTGDTAVALVPAQVLGLTSVSAIAAGENYSVAVTAGGTMYTWGANDFGQLGSGSTQSSSMPVAVAQPSNVKAIATKGQHTLALTTDGVVWAFGNNDNGQIGDGLTTNQPFPVQVTGLPLIAQIAAGSAHSLALTVDGQIMSWGSNAKGQLGNQSVISEYTGSPGTIDSLTSGYGNGSYGSSGGQGKPNPGGGGTGPKIDPDPGPAPQIYDVENVSIVLDENVVPSVRETDYTKVKLFWSCTPPANLAPPRYYIQRRIGNGSWSQIATTGSSTFAYEDSNLLANQTYNYRVRAVYGDLVTRPSNTAVYDATFIKGMAGQTTKIDYFKPGFSPFVPTPDHPFTVDFPPKRYLVKTIDLGDVACVHNDNFYELFAPYFVGYIRSQLDDSAEAITTLTPTFNAINPPPISPYGPNIIARSKGKGSLKCKGRNNYFISSDNVSAGVDFVDNQRLEIQADGKVTWVENYTDTSYDTDPGNTGFSPVTTNYNDIYQYNLFDHDPQFSDVSIDNGFTLVPVGIFGEIDGQYTQEAQDIEYSYSYDADDHLNINPLPASTGNGYFSKTLSNPYATEQFVSDAIAGGFVPYTDWTLSNITAQRELSFDELEFDLTILQYRFLVTPSVAHTLKWNEMFLPTPDSNSTDPELRHPAPQLVAKRTWNASNTTVSATFKIDPTTAYAHGVGGVRNGRYAIVMPPGLGLYNSNRNGNVSTEGALPIEHVPDSTKNTTGGFIYQGQGQSETYLNISPPHWSIANDGNSEVHFTLTWTGENFKVYVEDSTAAGGRREILSGYQFDQTNYGLRIYVVATVDTGDGQQINFTLSAHDAAGNDLGDDHAKISYVVPIDSLTTVDDTSGASYRKIALNGRPLPDEKPQHAAESDEKYEETFVDALTLELRHNTSDVYLPIPGSDLALLARRNVVSDVWNLGTGLREHERPDRPFGAGWTTNLCPHVHFVSKGRDSDPNVPQEPDYAYVTDENGATYKFVKYSVNGQPHYVPMPTAKHEEQTYLVSFDGYSFKHKYGTTITFGGRSIVLKVATDRLQGSNAQERHEFDAASTLVDRLGNEIDYAYDEQAVSLVPKTITAYGHPNLTLYIRQNNDGLITSVWDANGNETKYDYDYNPQHKIWFLGKVTGADGGETQYGYAVDPEDDLTPRPLDEPLVPQYHCDVDSITSSNNVTGHSTCKITYGFDHSKYSYKKDSSIPYDGYFVQTGLPRTVSKVALPNTSNETIFENQSELKLKLVDHLAVMTGQRQTLVTDAEQYSRTYRFTDGHPYALINLHNHVIDQADQPGVGYVYPCIVYYLTATIDQGSLGSESFTFDLNAGLALKSATDFCGKTTFYLHDDPWPVPSDYRAIFPAAYNNFYTEPTAQIDALQNTTTFKYNPRRLLQSRTDTEGRKVAYEFDSRGRRTAENIYPADATQSVQYTTWEYGSQDFPGFITTKTIHDLHLSNDPSGWGDNLVTTYVPDAAGRVQREIVDPGGQNLVTAFTYDLNGNKLSETDPRSHTTHFTYDERNRLTYVTYPDSSHKQFVYDKNSNKIAEEDENGISTLYEYDGLNRLKRQARDMNGNGQIDPGIDLVTSYTYNDVGSLANTIDPKGGVTTQHYDGLQRVTQIDHPAIPSTTYEYDPALNCGGNVFDSSSFKPTKTTDPAGYVTNIFYDALYRPLATSRQYQLSPPIFATTHTDFDNVGNLRHTIDPLSHTTETRYDALNRPVYAQHPDGKYVRTTYSSTGLKWQTQDECLKVTEIRYDEAGRATDVYAPEVYDSDSHQTVHPHTQTVYDVNSNVIATINPRGSQWDFTYDSRNRRTDEYAPAVSDADSGLSLRPWTHTDYDRVGNRTKVKDAHGNTSLYEPDAANRIFHVTGAAVPSGGNGQAMVSPDTTTTFDLNGNVHTVTDANGHVTTNYYDALNRLLATVDPQQAGTQYTYDPLGNRTSVSAGLRMTGMSGGLPILVAGSNPQTTTMTYDGLNRNLSTSYPSGTETFTYDAVNKLTRTDGNGRLTRYDTYDACNRITQIKYGDTQDNRAYAYDDAGRLLSATEGHGGATDVAYTYDALGRTLSETSQGFTHTYQYDLAGNRTRTQYGGTGRTLLSTYDEANRLQSLADGSSVTRYEYDLNGRVRRKLLPNGEIETTHYDALGRQSNSSDVSGSGVLYAYNYGYDAVGNLTQMAETKAGLPSRFVTMSYYPTDRLQTETVYKGVLPQGAPTASTTYAYDEIGNRTSRSVAGGLTTTYTYNGSGQLQGFSEPTGHSVSFGYDGNGNRLSRTEGLANDLYTYDSENRLIGLTKANTPYAYLYDYRCRRVSRTEGTATTQVVFSGGSSVQEYTLSGNGPNAPPPSLDVEFVRGSDWGGGVGGILYSVRGNAASYAHYDGRGDVTTRSNGSGSVTYQANYEAWGTRTHEFGASADRQRANTKEEDPTGLLDEGHRFRDLEAGCFISRDPAGFIDGPNLYAYVRQNPWSKFDPEGLYSWSEFKDDADTFRQGLTFGAVGEGLKKGVTNEVIGAGKFAYGATVGVGEQIGNTGLDYYEYGQTGSTQFKSAAAQFMQSQLDADNCVSDIAKNTVAHFSGYEWGNQIAEHAMNGDTDAFSQDMGGFAMLTGSAAASLRKPAQAIEQGGPKCFAAGTVVETPDGEKNIEDIKEGDTVLAYDFDTGQVVERRVLELVSNFTYYWAEVDIEGDVLHATRAHKFWVESAHEWIQAAELKPGMVVRLSGGSFDVVAKVIVRALPTPETTYNLIVEGEHNYFVGGHHVLVHNGYPEKPQYPPATKVDETFQFNFDTSEDYANSRAAGVRRAKAAGLISPNNIGHHINSVQTHPHLAAEPSNIAPEATTASHLQTHGGNWKNPTSGPLNIACP